MSNQNQTVIFKSNFRDYNEDRKLIYCYDCVQELIENSNDEQFTFDADDFDMLASVNETQVKCDMCNLRITL